MATRSTIALEFADGSVGQVYCHWDGYLDHNGRILREHYSDPWKLRDLIDLGDVSSLGEEVGEMHPFDAPSYGTKEYEEHEEKYGKMTTFYGRDRGEDPGRIKARRFWNFDMYRLSGQREEYDYILRTDGKWYVDENDGKGFVLLTEALINASAEDE